MNVDELKATANEQRAAVHPEAKIREQLREDGLRQAAQLQQSAATAVNVRHSQTAIGLRVYSDSMQRQVEVSGQRAPERSPSQDNETASLFDFEEVARNVMRFVGGVIRGAASSGAESEELNSLFAQAREGVARGIGMAREDLAGFINDDISTGIDRSSELIEEQLSGLERELLGDPEPQLNQVAGLEASVLASSNSGNVLIRTRDGDEVTISFSNESRTSSASAYYGSTSGGSGEGDGGNNVSYAQASVFESYERNGFYFNISGDLDEAELTALADLIGDIGDLAETFFDGNLDEALNQAVNLGYDESQLAGFAVQLDQRQSVAATRAYESVQSYNDAETDTISNRVRPIADYLRDLENISAQTREILAGEQDYESLVAEMIGTMEDVQIPDLISAINRFNSFNNRIANASASAEEV